VGVEARVFDMGATMTRQVQDCVDDAVRAVVAAIFRTHRHTGHDR
jgi:hypothetical protein